MADWRRGLVAVHRRSTTSISCCANRTQTRRCGFSSEQELPTERPPEGWLVKTWIDGVLVDLIYRPAGLTIDHDYLAELRRDERRSSPDAA